ncbi:MAG: STAS domain-containing protein [Solirubrobacterales bacterium]|nr:STAS domain-containing protein [Solirubrobacterales bacterium]
MSSTGMTHDTFDVRMEERDGALWILPEGDLDIASAPDFRDAATLAARSDATDIVVDLRGLELMDSTGLKELVRLALGPEAARVSVVPGNDHVQQVLRISGLEAELRTRDA